MTKVISMTTVVDGYLVGATSEVSKALDSALALVPRAERQHQDNNLKAAASSLRIAKRNADSDVASLDERIARLTAERNAAAARARTLRRGLFVLVELRS